MSTCISYHMYQNVILHLARPLAFINLCIRMQIYTGKIKVLVKPQPLPLTMCTRTQFTWQVNVSARQVTSITMCIVERNYTWQVKVLARPQTFSSVTKCTRTHYTWKVKILIKPQAFIYYNLY